MTRWQHAVIEKRIVNHDNGGRSIVCAWDDCTHRATSLYEVRQHEHPRGASCDDVEAGLYPGARHYHYAFCSHKCMRYWTNATGTNALDSIARTGRAYGNLPAGERHRR
jgi:hypothetical protein